MTTLVPQLIAAVLLVLLNGFFVAAEFALVKIRETQLLAFANKGHRRAKTALEIVGKLDAALSATQLGITMASLGLGWLGKPAFAALLAPVIRFLTVGGQSQPALASDLYLRSTVASRSANHPVRRSWVAVL